MMAEIIDHEIRDDGKVLYIDDNGTERTSGKAVQDYVAGYRGDIINDLHTFCDDENEELQSFVCSHHETLKLNHKFELHQYPFNKPRPEKSPLKGKGILGLLFSGRGAKIDAENQIIRGENQRLQDEWDRCKTRNVERHQEETRVLEKGRFTSVDDAELFLETHSGSGEWDYQEVEVTDDMTGAVINLEPPNMDYFPDTEATVVEDKLRAQVKKMPKGKLNDYYVQGLHSGVFEAIGNAFVALPTVQEVVVTVLDAHDNPKTCRLSVRCTRDQWNLIDLSNLKAVDPIATLDSLGASKAMTKTGKLGITKPIILSRQQASPA